MPDLIGIAEIATRLGLDMGSVRRLIARESEALQIELHRGKGDRLLLAKDDADRLVASYEARRGPTPAGSYEARRRPTPADVDAGDTVKYDRYGFFYLIQLVPESPS